MLFNIILIVSYLFCVFLIHITYRKFFVYRSGKIMLTTIPSINIGDEDIQSLIKSGNKKLKILSFVFSILSVSMLILNEVWTINLFVLLIYGYIIADIILFDKYMKKMRALKNERGFKVNTKKYIDVSISKKIEKMKIGKKMWLIPFIIIAIEVIVANILFEKVDILMVGLCILVLLSIVMIAYVINRLPVKIISSDSEKNLYYNSKRIIYVQERIFYFACIYSVLLSLAIFISSNDEYSYIPFLILILPTLIFSVYLVYLLKKVDNTIEECFDGDQYFVDEDIYYDVLGYNNPDDNRIFVSDPFFSGNLIINRGNKKGKVVFGISYALLVALLIPLFMLGMEAKYNPTFSNTKIVIGTKFYRDEINYSNIESINLIDDLPEGRIIKTNGVGLSYQSYGSFRIQNVGQVRLYLYNDVEKIIEVKQKKGKTIFFNDKTIKNTENMYNNLTEKYKVYKESIK